MVNLLLSLTCWCSEHKRSKAALGVELVPCARPSALLVAASRALAAVARALRALSIAMVGFVFAIRVRVRGRSRAVPSEKVKKEFVSAGLLPDPTCLIFSQGKVWKTSSSFSTRAPREPSPRRAGASERLESAESAEREGERRHGRIEVGRPSPRGPPEAPEAEEQVGGCGPRPARRGAWKTTRLTPRPGRHGK